MSAVDFWSVIVSILTVIGILYGVIKGLSKGLANIFNLKIIQPIYQSVKDLTTSVNEFRDMVKDTFKGYDRKFYDNDKRLEKIEEHLEKHDIDIKEHETKINYIDEIRKEDKKHG